VEVAPFLGRENFLTVDREESTEEKNRQDDHSNAPRSFNKTLSGQKYSTTIRSTLRPGGVEKKPAGEHQIIAVYVKGPAWRQVGSIEAFTVHRGDLGEDYQGRKEKPGGNTL